MKENHPASSVLLPEKPETEHQSLSSHDELFRLLVKSVKDYAIFALDPNGIILNWNTGAERLKGYSEKEVVGTFFGRFYTNEDLARNHPQYELELAKKNGVYEEEGWRIKKDGSRFWANVVITALHTDNGTLIGFGKVTRDLTARKKAEEELRSLNQNLEARVQVRTAELEKAKLEAENSVKMRDDFLSIASHELKTPLTSLKLRTQFRQRQLRRGGIESFKQDRFLEMMNDDEKQVNRLIRLVDDMLDITRLTSGKLSLNKESCDLNHIIQDVVSACQDDNDLTASMIQIETQGPVVGYFDPYRIEQAITNLITNAIKYGLKKPITVSSRIENDMAILSVKDQGIGIQKKDQERIFQQFERAVSANEVSGLGLGLFITNQLIEAHKGRISVESEPGAGSTFTIRLPVDSD